LYKTLLYLKHIDNSLSVKLHLRDGRIVKPSVCSSVFYLFVLSVGGVHPMGERTAMPHRNLRRR